MEVQCIVPDCGAIICQIVMLVTLSFFMRFDKKIVNRHEAIPAVSNSEVRYSR